MTVAFATSDQLSARLPDFDPEDAADVAITDALLVQATEYLNGEIGVDTVVLGVSPSASDRIFYGMGTGYLAVDAHVGTIAADDVVNANATIPYFVDRGRHLIATDSVGVVYDWIRWPAGVPFTVSAIWGVTAAPGDLVTACLDLAEFWYIRSRKLTAEISISDLTIEIPASVRAVINRRRLQSNFRSGVTA